MKRLFTLLLIACSAFITISAQQRAKRPSQPTPIHVKELFNNIIHHWGNPSDEVYSVNKNPNTNLIESSVRITYFVADNDKYSAANPSLNLNDISEAFKQDEPTSYQLLHLSPGNNESFSLRAVDGNGKDKIYLVRASNNEEMWLLCTKNPENPQLRDAYAIKWSLSNDKSKILGGIFQITSLRPDLYEKELEMSRNAFRIDGRVGYDLTDSLYVVYMADTSEELDKLADDAFVAYMPVVNKRFNYSVEIDKPKVGRIRTVMPDGSLCHLWTNLDFVPGETYRITTHNGYYDEDRDYERRVGRYSGKSLLNREQIQGIDDVINTNDVVEDMIPDHNEGDVSFTLVRDEFHPTPDQQMRLEAQSTAIKGNIEAIKATYTSLAPFVTNRTLAGAGSSNYFKQIIKLNKELDAKFQKFIKNLKGIDGAPSDWKQLYGEILEFYSEQSQAYGELYKNVGVLPKSAKDAQKHVNQLMEKYMKEMGKAMTDAK